MVPDAKAALVWLLAQGGWLWGFDLCPRVLIHVPEWAETGRGV